MSRFIRTDAGYLNPARIITVNTVFVPSNNKAREHIQYLAGDDVLHTFSDEDDIGMSSAAVIHAAPGYFVVELGADPPHEMFLSAVIAWRVDEYASPICLDSIFEKNFFGVLDPTGKVTRAEFDVWDSLEDFRVARLAEITKLQK